MSPALAAAPPPTKRRTTLSSAVPSSSSQANLAVRTSCNFCRDKKIRCSKTGVEEGGCDRCKREGVECRYDVRAPIGRPKKRKVDEPFENGSSSTLPTNGRHAATNGIVAHRLSSASSPARSLSSPSMYAQSPVSFNGGVSYPNGRQQSSRTSWPGQLPDVAPSSSPHDNSAFAAAHGDAHRQSEMTSQTPSLERHDDVRRGRPQTLSPSLDESMPLTSATSSTSVLATSPSRATFSMDAPSLDDLGLAAFLESLDTLEIKREDGLTANMLAALSAVPPANGGVGSTHSGNVNGSTSTLATGMPSSQSDWTAAAHLSLANVFGSTSYAVPADLSWADPSWLDQIARPSGAGSSMPSAHPVAVLPPSWPRGVEAGMGLGELRTPDGQPIHPVQSIIEAERGVDAPSTACAKTGKPKCCCSDNDAEQQAQTQPPASSPSNATRVHCVPNPTGRGCTCLCDVSVALINVRTTLRQARGDDREVAASLSSSSSSTTGATVNGAASKQAASTLQLTLSASQAVTAHCACSASCPTCRTDPSTSLSASLLVSTALQIYMRAVRTLRQGFGATDKSGSTAAAAAPASTSHAVASSASDWDVSIGQYKPVATNARRIALFAMKLELRDLRDAIAKVSRAACGSNFTAGSDAGQQHNDDSRSATDLMLEDEVNPIDRLVIRKLHQQLGDVLRTVEGIEEQQDAERNATSVESL